MKKLLLLINPASGTNDNLKIAKQVKESLKDAWQKTDFAFPLIFSGKHINSNLLTYIHAKKIKIQAAPTALNIDGEVGFNAPIEIQILENKLRVVCGV